jgi:hypothetical protein
VDADEQHTGDAHEAALITGSAYDDRAERIRAVMRTVRGRSLRSRR